MRRRTAVSLASALVAIAFAGARPATAAEWRIDPTQSRLGFVGTQAGSPFEGRFRQFTADIRFDAADLARSKVVVVIDMASAGTGNGPRDEAVRSADWFNVERFPQGRFETTGFRALGGDRYGAEATLTIRGVSRPVVLPFSLQATPAGTRAAGELTINRIDYGVGQGQWASPQVVGHDVAIRFDLLATPVP